MNENLHPPRGFGALAAALLVLLSAGPAAQAQQPRQVDLGRLYRQAQTQALLQARLRTDVRPLPPAALRTPHLDSLRARLASPGRGARGVAPAAPVPRIYERRVVRRLERAAFEERFAEVNWAYLGANSRATLDTTQTRVLRARLQAHYGDPTRTVVDDESLARRPASGENIQFDYWFVINDSIPVKVVDTGGPFDRGVVFAAPVRFRERLPALRAAFFRPLLSTSLRARYVDYYYDTGQSAWYRAGYDGRRYFARRVPRSRVVPGQRPSL